MHKLWMLYDPRQALVGMFVFVFSIILINHFFVLSSDRYTFLNDAKASKMDNRAALPSK
ncbi:MAG: light-harvesting antenna LH1, alpha subunit [Myxococcales bacterium]|jgi:light-harvesting complex 1 alpha chain|nr:light-harvesting antenna LH1, alpha subunit [Myxococcales bacterium]